MYLTPIMSCGCHAYSPTTAAFNFVDEDMSGCLDSEEWRRFLDRFKSSVAVVNMRSMFLHLDKVRLTRVWCISLPIH